MVRGDGVRDFEIWTQEAHLRPRSGRRCEIPVETRLPTLGHRVAVLTHRCLNFPPFGDRWSLRRRRWRAPAFRRRRDARVPITSRPPWAVADRCATAKRCRLDLERGGFVHTCSEESPGSVFSFFFVWCAARFVEGGEHTEEIANEFYCWINGASTREAPFNFLHHRPLPSTHPIISVSVRRSLTASGQWLTRRLER